MPAELSDVLVDVWSQILLHNSSVVKLGAERFLVSTSKKRRLREVKFTFEGRTIIGIQQNPDTKSNWATMAREGIKVMQFIEEGRYIAAVAAGKVTLYGTKSERLAD
jgi:hypothetical protein